MGVRTSREVLAILLVVSGLALHVGCEGDNGQLPTAPVTGAVTFDGKPLANAEIWLVPTSEEVKSAKLTIRPYAKTKADGTFTVTSYLVDDGAPLGDYAIMLLPAGQRATEEELATDTPSENNVRGQRAGAFPSKYKTPAASGLSFTVKEGPNQLTLDLKSK